MRGDARRGSHSPGLLRMRMHMRGRPGRRSGPGGVYFQSAHLVSALVVNTWSPGSVLSTLR